ncbi:hypothetical protein BX616_003185 [Lobosporangium transversale]|nr:hypothetical protein BX616_003185 [Lobosporangium transversale]
MSSFEFRLNIICSLIVLVVFPTIQFVFRNNHAYREAAPQMAFSIVLLAIAFLGFRTHFRFKSLLKNALLTINENTQGVAEKLEYFKDMNTILTGAMLGSGIALGVSSADGLTPNPVIAHNKFASDFLVTNVNFFEFIIWVTLVLIFYPRRSIVGTAFGVSSGGAGSVTRTVPTSTRPQKSQVDNSDTKYSNGNGTNNARSSLVPYRAPDESNISKSDYIDIERSGSTRHNHGGYNDNDTYPLTKAVGQDDSGDAMQLNTFKIMHDERSLSRNSVAGSLSSVSPRYQQQVISSVPQSPRSPVSPTLSSPRRNGATSPTPFDLPYHQRIAGRGTMTSPGSPSFGSAVPRQPASAVTAPEITHVGQHAFILEEAPRSSRQRTKLATQTQWQEGQRQQQQTTITDYNQARPLSPSTPTTPTIPTTPMRVRKEFRSPPTS